MADTRAAMQRLNKRAVWLLEVRNKGTKQQWSATGANWHDTRRDALKSKADAEGTWEMLEYRVMKYLPRE